MGETDLHRDWMIRILEILRYRYRDQRVYVASNLLVYYEEGCPSRFVVPDNFVVLNCSPERRRMYRVWEEGKSPSVVFEITSRSTKHEDLVTKLPLYERMGVSEYFLYDPSDSYLDVALQGCRLIDGTLREMELKDGSLTCETLGIRMMLVGADLVMFDINSGEQLLTGEEAERAAKEAERAAKEAEIKARLAAEARIRDLEAELRRRDG